MCKTVTAVTAPGFLDNRLSQGYRIMGRLLPLTRVLNFRHSRIVIAISSIEMDAASRQGSCAALKMDSARRILYPHLPLRGTPVRTMSAFAISLSFIPSSWFDAKFRALIRCTYFSGRSTPYALQGQRGRCPFLLRFVNIMHTSVIQPKQEGFHE